MSLTTEEQRERDIAEENAWFARVREIAEELAILSVGRRYGNGVVGGYVEWAVADALDRMYPDRHPARQPARRRKQHSAAVALRVAGARCKQCGSDEELVLDHVKPLARGGADEPENLQVLCWACNSRKGARV